MVISIAELLSTPFLGRKLENQIRIILEGKPRPKLSMTYAEIQKLQENLSGTNLRLLAVKTLDSTVPLRYQTFDLTVFDHIPWLTGNSKLFFCWPCLLFNRTKTLFNTTGVLVKGYYRDLMKMHLLSTDHMQATVDLFIFTRKYNNAAVLDQNVTFQKRNKRIIKHGGILKRLIDVVCTCVSQRRSSCKGNNSGQLQLEDCVKMLQLLGNYDVENAEFTDLAIKLIQESPKMLNDIVDAITEVLKTVVKRETKMSTYVSVIMSQHSNDLHKSKISTVLRYLKNGKVCERFIGFSQLSSRKVDFIFTTIQNILSKFDISDRFLAYSIDGGIVLPPMLQDLVNILKKSYSFTFFAPWYDHQLENILKQSLLRFKTFSNFFGTSDAICVFFQMHHKRWQTLKHFTFDNFVIVNKWFIEQRKYLICVFDSILDDSRKWEAEDITKVSAFQKFLEKFETVFLMITFDRLFDVIAPFSKILRNETPEQDFLNEIKTILQRERDNGFQKLWDDSVKEYEATQSHFDMEWKCKCQEQFKLLMAHVVSEVEVRFHSIDYLDFIHLLEPEVYMNEDETFYAYMKKLCTAHSPYFDFSSLHTELNVLKKNASEFPQTSISALLDFFVKMNLKYTFQEIYKLAELVMTLPIKKSFNEEGASKITKITNWCYTPEDSISSGDISVLCVEVKYLQELKRNPIFYDHVMENFLKVNRTIPFLLL